MAKQGNTLMAVARLSMRTARQYMQAYSHPKSPQKFTQPQLMTCLVLRAYLKATYRGVIEFLDTSNDLRDAMGLEQLPHYSTLKRFADRSATQEIVEAMLVELLDQVSAVTDGPPKAVALDSTGFETTSASAHYRARSGQARQHYVKVSLSVSCGTLMPIGLVVDWGPRNDKAEARPLLAKTAAVVQPEVLYADAGYDGEWLHRYCREDWGVRSWIKAPIYRKDGKRGGTYRSLMTPRRLKRAGYGQRWHVESFIGGLKRTTGSGLTSRHTASLFQEAGLRVLAYAMRR